MPCSTSAGVSWLDIRLLFNYTKSWCFNRRELLDPIATINRQYSVTKQCLLEYKIRCFS